MREFMDDVVGSSDWLIDNNGDYIECISILALEKLLKTYKIEKETNYEEN